MYNLYFLNFNNKYNRRLLHYDVLDDYLPFVVGQTQQENFKWADEIRTEVIANITETPNYCVVCDDDDEIIARFFVVEDYWTRQNQYKLSLERDTMADYYYDILEMPMFMEKATIRDLNDPSIYVRDGQFNQIKKKEYLLRDDTRCPWVVGYINRETASTTITSSFPSINAPTYEVSGISSWEHYNKTYTWKVDASTHFALSLQPSALPQACFPAVYAFNESEVVEKERSTTPTPLPQTGYVYEYHDTLFQTQKIDKLLTTIRSNSSYFTQLNNYAKDNVSNYMEESNLLAINNTIIKDTATDIYYRITLDYGVDGDYEKIALNQTLNDYLNSNLLPPLPPDTLRGEGDNNTWKAAITTQQVKVVLTQIFTSITLTIDNDRNHLEDAPYDMFCIPLGNLGVRWGSLTDTFTTQKEIAIAAATSISEELDANCYDIQLLPYFPCREIMKSDDTNLRVDRTKFSLIKDSEDNPLSVLIWARKAEFSFPITNSLSNQPYPSSVLTKKIKHETEFYRLCSPNYSSVFEFSPAANNGVMRYEVSCSYKPYQPYIHINPYFNEDGLYGGNYRDARGLVCAGDFSLSQIQDKWQNYQLNNKNFQQMFDRQIDSLELQQEVGRIQDYVGAAVGTLTGASGGAAGGAMTSGSWQGAVIGGAAGGVASLGGGIADIALNEKLRADQIGLTSTQFRLSLDNIKAQPDTLTKITAYNQQNKLFPFIEVYEATSAEIDYLKEQLKYGGMSINRIATISDFLNGEEQYVRGRVIRMPDTLGKHTSDVIANTLASGIYIS